MFNSCANGRQFDARIPLPIDLPASDYTISEQPPAKRGRGRSAILPRSRSLERRASDILLLRLHEEAYVTTASILLIHPLVHPLYRCRLHG